MNSVSRPQSSFNRLGSFTSFGVKGTIHNNIEQDSAKDLAEMGYVYKQSQ
jgi:hypothetical protein